MLAHFARGSSKIDWCESNYVHVTFIAEFYNTVSNVIFLVLPPFLIYLFRPYSKHVCPRVNILWVLMVVIGLSSAYFHATLSLVGQLMDEIAILWVLMTAFALFTPRWMLALGPFGNDRKIFQYSIIAASLICTWLGFLYPVANAFVLMLMGAPFVFMLFAELKSCRDVKVLKLGFVCAGWLLVAVVFWVNDKVFCEISRSVSFPYLHCVWHILIFLASYTGCVLGAYFYAASEFPELGPTLSYWPNWSCDWGVPYIALRSPPNHLSP